MTEFKTFLTTPAIISGILMILIFIFYKRTFKSKRKNLWIGFSVFFAFYLLIVGGAAVIDIKYQKELYSYDLNNDGLFSGEEITDKQEAAMVRHINDVGRNFTVFTGAFVAGIFGLVAYIIAWGFGKYKSLKTAKKN